MTQTAAEIDWGQRRRQWQDDLADLVRAVRGWSESRGWAAYQYDHQIAEHRLGQHVAPALRVSTAEGVLIMEPVARVISGGGEGRVDIYSLQTLRKLLLIADGGGWRLYTEDRVRWPQPWNEPTFAQLPEALAAP